MQVEVRRQPWALVLAFQFETESVLCVPGSLACRRLGILLSLPPMSIRRVLGVGYCAQLFVGLGTQAQALTLGGKCFTQGAFSPAHLSLL